MEVRDGPFLPFDNTLTTGWLIPGDSLGLPPFGQLADSLRPLQTTVDSSIPEEEAQPPETTDLALSPDNRT